MNILVIEDNPADFAIVENVLQSIQGLKIDISWCQDLRSGFEALQNQSINILLLDLVLPDSSGIETLDAIRQVFPGVPTIVLTGLDNEALGIEAVSKGAQDYLFKGSANLDILCRVIPYAIERQRIISSLDKATEELRIANAKLQRLSLTDPLTRLHNRLGLQTLLQVFSERSWRDGTQFFVILVDLDNFKPINDKIGHSAGDFVLKETARKIQSMLRKTDQVGRIGGDEFMILLPHTRLAEAHHIAEKIRLGISNNPLSLGSQTLTITASIGVINSLHANPTLDQLISDTHFSLYKSKGLGKNRVCLDFNDSNLLEFDQNFDESFMTEAARVLRSRDHLSSVFYPIFDLATEKRVGCEVLARSDIPGFEMPHDFFRLARDASILGVVDQFCLANSLKTDVFGRKHINVFPSTLIETPLDHLIPAEANEPICFEINEQQILGDPSYLTPVTNELKKRGHLIALENIGHGKSSVESLLVLEPDICKISPRYVQNLSQSPEKQRVLHRLQSLFANMDMQVCLNGIENRNDLTLLQQMGFQLGQGFFWGKPSERI